MTNIIRCDFSGDTVDFEGSYQLTLYNRATKTQCKLDIGAKQCKKLLLTNVDTKAMKWKKWDGESKKYVEVE